MFPGMRFVANITMIALEMNKFPSEVYQQYRNMPNDIALISGALDYKRKLEDREREKIEAEQEKVRRTSGYR